jgi:hypothetical protein
MAYEAYMIGIVAMTFPLLMHYSPLAWLELSSTSIKMTFIHFAVKKERKNIWKVFINVKQNLVTHKFLNFDC